MLLAFVVVFLQDLNQPKHEANLPDGLLSNLPDGHISHRVGNGNGTSFLKDVWMGNSSLDIFSLGSFIYQLKKMPPSLIFGALILNLGYHISEETLGRTRLMRVLHDLYLRIVISAISFYSSVWLTEWGRRTVSFRIHAWDYWVASCFLFPLSLFDVSCWNCMDENEIGILRFRFFSFLLDESLLSLWFCWSDCW